MIEQTVTTFVVTHLSSDFDQIPIGDSIFAVNLEELEIPEFVKGNDLAESRFFFSRHPFECSSDVVGFVSARWNDRFPDMPHLSNLAGVVGLLPKGCVFAPLITSVPSRVALRLWIGLQNLDHPGMGSILEGIANEAMGVKTRKDIASKRLGVAILGGQVFLGKENFLRLTYFMRHHLTNIISHYGKFPRFNYSCSRCGQNFEDGVGRWGRSRHLGFLAERLIALFFILNPEISPVALSRPDLLSKLKSRRYRDTFSLATNFMATKFLRLINRVLRPCGH
jgi:hypothetical protein